MESETHGTPSLNGGNLQDSDQSRWLGALAAFVWLFLLPAVCLAAEPPSGFRNMKWGMSPSKAMKLFSDAGDGLKLYVPVHKSVPALYDVDVKEEVYSFAKGKFYNAMAFVEGRPRFDRLKSALVKVYGPPTFSNEQTQLFKWKWPAEKIEIHLYYTTRHSQGTVGFFNNAI